MRFKREIEQLEINKFCLNHKGIIQKLNAFLIDQESKFRLDPGGHCNGFAALFCRYAAHGKSSEWLEEILAVQNITNNDINHYETHQLMMKMILMLSQFQTGSRIGNSMEYQQLHMENIDMIVETDFFKLSSIYEKGAFSTSNFYDYISEQNLLTNRLRVQSLSNLDNEIFIEIKMDRNHNYIAKSLPENEELIFISLEHLFAWTQKKAADLFKIQYQYYLVFSLVDANQLKVDLIDKAYALLGNKAFDTEEILDNILTNSVTLLGTEAHTIALFKQSADSFIVYDIKEDLPVICNKQLMLGFLSKLEGHSSFYVFQKSSPIPDSKHLLSMRMFENLKKLDLVKLYENGAQLTEDSNSEEGNDAESSTETQNISELQDLSIFCLKSNLVEVLLYHLREISPTFLKNCLFLFLEFAKSGHYNLVNLCIEKGLFLETTDEDQMTPLHLACKYQHPELVELLLSSGADATSQNFDHKTVFDTAVHSQNREILSLLKTHAEKSNLLDYLSPKFIELTEPKLNLLDDLFSAAFEIENENSPFLTDPAHLDSNEVQKGLTPSETKTKSPNFFAKKSHREDSENLDEVSHKKQCQGLGFSI
ncbi:MAG: ankyrin repeat domain-containing protein [Tatlockia sp.]|nr:ankyrin repeat domain-containing protein [Tatlockia sp.]